MKRTVGPLQTVLMLLSLVIVAQTSARSAQSSVGEALYVKYGCYECHGFQGQAQGLRSTGKGSLAYGVVLAPKPIPYAPFLAQVRRPRRAMPAYSLAVLSDGDVAKIYEYLATIPTGKDAAAIPLLRRP